MINWFTYNLIHPAQIGLPHIALLNMSSNCSYDWLWKLFEIKIVSYLLSSGASIHHGHVTIHEDEVVAAVAVFLNV